MAEKKEQSFEDMIRDLDKKVKDLESGELDLDASIKTYEEAVTLIKSCEKKLTSATKTINKLVEENGSLKDFEVEE